MADANSTKVATGLVRFSYAHVFEPASINGDDDNKKFSVSILIPKKDKKTLAKIKAAIEVAKKQGAAAKWGGKIPKRLKEPLRDGDIDKEDDDNYIDCFFLNANSNTKPGIIDLNREAILDTTEFYSGCWGRACITFYPFDVSGNKGIACGLNSLQKLKDGEPLGGGHSNPVDDFGSDDDDFDYSQFEDVDNDDLF